VHVFPVSTNVNVIFKNAFTCQVYVDCPLFNVFTIGDIWNYCDGNKLHAVTPNPTVGVTKQNGSVSRGDAVIINRLQIGYTHAIHAHLLGDDQAVCTTCYTFHKMFTVQSSSPTLEVQRKTCSIISVLII